MVTKLVDGGSHDLATTLVFSNVFQNLSTRKKCLINIILLLNTCM